MAFSPTLESPLLAPTISAPVKIVVMGSMILSCPLTPSAPPVSPSRRPLLFKQYLALLGYIRCGIEDRACKTQAPSGARPLSLAVINFLPPPKLHGCRNWAASLSQDCAWARDLPG